MNIYSDFFEEEKALLEEARELIKGESVDGKALLIKFAALIEQFDKTIRDVEKIIKISDGQQEYLHKVQSDLKKEIEDRIRAEEKLKYFAAIDSLTGCYNRGMGLTLLENEIKNIRRNKSVFSICYIDVNGLKYVNDKFGHSEGDELLVLVCEFVRKGIKENDILCRLGGDEFLILFPNSTEYQAEEVMRRIILNLEMENGRATRPYPVSFSYGVFGVDQNNSLCMDEMIQRADIRMYQNKQKHKKIEGVQR